MITILMLFCGLATLELQVDPEMPHYKDPMEVYVLPEDVYSPMIALHDDFICDDFECEYC